jgi:tetratricopeptide (TPR) repeat protein
MISSDPLTPLRHLLTEGRFREAVEWRAQAEDLLSGRPEGRLLAATAATRVGEVESGRADATMALEEFRERADRDGRMRCMNLLGAIAFEQGDMTEARRCFGEGLFLAQELQDTLVIARASNNLASVAHLQGETDDAMSLYRTALLAYTRLGDRHGAAETYHNLAMNFRQRELWSDATDATYQAVRHAELSSEPWLLSLVLAGKAELHLDMGDPALARTVLMRAEALAGEAGDEVGIGEVHRLQGLVLLAEGQPERALAEAERGLAIAQKSGSTLLEGECAIAAALACRDLGRNDATSHFRRIAEEKFAALGAVKLLADLRRTLPV